MKITRTTVFLFLFLFSVSCSTEEILFEENKIIHSTPTLNPTDQHSGDAESDEDIDLTALWSYGLTSIRTGDPLIIEGGEHQLDESLIAFGYNVVVESTGASLAPQAAPLHGGEQLVLAEEYQNDHNVREFARIFTIMAPIRDAILYHFEEMSKNEWLNVTSALTFNRIKTNDAAEINGRSILSTEQIYDYVASGNAEGSPVMRYLEEAELELKCLAFQNFDFTNPEGKNHCIEQNIEIGAGIKLP